MAFTWLDLVAAVLIAAGAFRGFARGLVREGMAFAGLAVGVLLAAQWQAEVAGVLRPFIGGGDPTNALAYLLVVMAALGCATLATSLLLRLRGLFLVGWLDRLGGALFGAGQGAVLAALALFLLLQHRFMGLDAAVKDSELAVAVLRGVARAVASLPPELPPMADFFRVPALP